jgi:hypothetical protein
VIASARRVGEVVRDLVERLLADHVAATTRAARRARGEAPLTEPQA